MSCHAASTFQSRHCENALLEAVSYRRFEIASLLLSHSANPDVLDFCDRTPLILAAQSGSADLAHLLLDCGADPGTEDDNGRNAVYYALRSRSPNCGAEAASSSVQTVHAVIDALMGQPQPLTRLCRTVIRRCIRENRAGHGCRLKPHIDKFRADEVPKSLKKFLAYDP